jgi:DNA-binding NarL/FixJ family response regulator
MDGIEEVTLFIADDHAAFCKRLGEMLAEMDGIRVIGRAGNATEAIHSISQLKPDIIVLDIRMPPGAGGFDVLRKIREKEGGPRVIMLTAFSNTEYRKKSMAMGADYYFDKSSDLKKMLMTIKGLVSNGTSGK